MKTSTLLQSSLLAAGLLLGGTSAVHADSAYPIILHGGNFHPYSHDYHSCKHTPGWHTGHRHDRGYHFDQHWKPHGKHNKGHHGDHGQGDWHDYRRHGKHDDRNDGGRHGQQSRSAGIGYTGRS